jgi:hypothetical protein
VLNDTSHIPLSSRLRNITVFFIGNSVVRHYSFSFTALLNGLQDDVSLDRGKEKHSCVDVIGVKSCDHFSDQANTHVKFLWNNHIGRMICDDIERDFCTALSTKSLSTCFQKTFSRATDRDILIIGSMPCNTSLLCDRNYTSYGLHIHELVSNVLKPGVISVDDTLIFINYLITFFPGRIIWLSYPVVTSMETHKLVSSVNQVISEGVTSSNNPRVLYLNLQPLQSENAHLYVDEIHHPGLLSMWVVKTIEFILS